MWTGKEISELRKKAYETFGTEIPLSAEILKLVVFLEQCRFNFKRELPKLTRTVRYSLKWLPNFWMYPIEAEIPIDAIPIIESAVHELLNARCDELADMCGYKKDILMN